MPSWASYGLSIMRIWEKIDRVIMLPHCTIPTQSYHVTQSRRNLNGLLLMVHFICSKCDSSDDRILADLMNFELVITHGDITAVSKVLVHQTGCFMGVMVYAEQQQPVEVWFVVEDICSEVFVSELLNVKSLAPERCSCNLKLVIFIFVSRRAIWSISYEICLRLMP